MSKNGRPWMKWYWSDWRSDPGLRMCGFAARGLWADLLGLMHEGQPYGHLIVNGRAPTPRQIAALLGGGIKEVTSLMDELEAAGVFSRDDNGVIYSRRMVRDWAVSEEGRAWVAKRWGKSGHPSGVDRSPPNSPPSRGIDRAPTESPITSEARSQKPEATAASGDSVAARDPPHRTNGNGADHDQPEPTHSAGFFEFWLVYPLQQARGLAFRAYVDALNRRVVTHLQLIDGVKRYAEEMAGKPQFLTTAAKWIEGERWLDQPRPSVNGAVGSADAPVDARDHADRAFEAAVGLWRNTGRKGPMPRHASVSDAEHAYTITLEEWAAAGSVGPMPAPPPHLKTVPGSRR